MPADSPSDSTSHDGVREDHSHADAVPGPEPTATDTDSGAVAVDDGHDRGLSPPGVAETDAELDPEVLDLLGGVPIATTADVEVPERLIDQVIGQERARDVVTKAASQRRHVMMIGSPGTGKSMLSKAMTELLPKESLQDVLVYHNPEDGNQPKVRTVPMGKGKQIIEAHKEEARKAGQFRNLIMWGLIAVVLMYSLLIAGEFLLGILAAGIVFLLFRYGSRRGSAAIPNLIVTTDDDATAPFIDATGAHAGALLGDVRHDPYQSGGLETPSHDRVEPGAIHKANKGVLFIDEINTLDIRSQQHLLTAMQEREFSITGQSERSSGAMVKTEPVPTDFVLVAAGNLDAMSHMHPALRSRIKGYGYEVYMDDTIEDSAEMRQKYVRFVAQEVAKDGRLPPFTNDAVAEVILEARRRAGRKGHLTLEFRNLGGLVRVAGDMARGEDSPVTTREHVLDAKRRARSIEQQIADEYIERRKDYNISMTEGSVVGRVNGLAVMGEDSGIVLPVMAEVTPSQGPGSVIATGKLQEIAQEAVQNVSAIIKKLSGTGLNGKDVHIQFVQAGQGGVDGDSASVTIATAVISALEDLGVDQSTAMTGSLSVRGDVLPVGGITHKIEAAAKAGMKTVIIPAANLQDVMIEDEYKELVDIVPVTHISEVLKHSLEGSPDMDSLASRVAEFTDTVLDGVGRGGSPNPQ
ncbi:Lon-B peptidase. Serine peptidase. MEROPS family S16 [Halogranum gelatinilyticum]|uniref:Archaeal Lon protease n=1 Tax=Halogranum gelatinilyticum TaxID=660521 RepID=A0A1G9UTM9_9EURY|nr:ATP-dependent protease LonB [Halogranum gelatinilyticum]SDM63284.1 Lon-B peptidase. Serine peptidase. MEROPS family S16 [Halogranum gelatinilyticum]